MIGIIFHDKNIFSDAETEIWNLFNGDNRLINPTLPEDDYRNGIGLYIVPFDFCCGDFDCAPPTSAPTTTSTSTTTTTSISTTRNAVLVLGTYDSNNKPFIVDFNGKFLIIFSNINFHCSGNINEDLDFEYGDDTVAHFGCGATLQNVFWYFGGYIYPDFKRPV